MDCWVTYLSLVLVGNKQKEAYCASLSCTVVCTLRALLSRKADLRALLWALPSLLWHSLQ